MRLFKSFTVKCCVFTSTSEKEFEVIDNLMEHIEKYHPKIYKNLEKEGRKLAASQNGCGYFDSGEPKGSDWHLADKEFRYEWMRDALEYRLEKVSVKRW